MCAALCLALLPPLLLGGGFGEWLQRACIFLVISCPCALVISVPLSFFGGIGAASKRGVLVKGSNYLEALAEMETIVFDKTGTLTKGEFKVTQIRPEGMGITWDDVFAAIKYEKEFLESHGYWYTIVNDFQVTDEFCQMIKDKILAKYGEWNA